MSLEPVILNELQLKSAATQAKIDTQTQTLIADSATKRDEVNFHTEQVAETINSNIGAAKDDIKAHVTTEADRVIANSSSGSGEVSSVMLGQGVLLPEAGGVIEYDGNTYLQSGRLVDISSYPNFPEKLIPLTNFNFINKGPLLDSANVLDIAMDDDLIIAGGVSGRADVSFDGGETFERKDLGFGTSNVIAVKIRGDLVIAVGSAGKAAISRNRAQDFELVDIGASTAVLLCVDISDDLIIIGDGNGNTYRSENNAESFDKVNSGLSFAIQGVAISASIVLLAMANNRIRRSINKGLTYTAVVSPTSGTFVLRSAAMQGNIAAIVGGGGTLYVSKNRGESFSSINSGFGNNPIYSVKISGNQAILMGVAEGNGVLVRALNDFTTLEPLRTIIGGILLYSCAFYGHKVAVGGQNGTFRLSKSTYLGFDTYTPNLYMRIK
ncbi:hypothetical protein M3926_000419 [Vibrio metschnikovii]|nr:hypothetical protein [Vibrio metschnikovii]